MSSQAFSYEAVTVTDEDIRYLQQCCREININLPDSIYNHEFGVERNRLLHYLYYLVIKNDPEPYKSKMLWKLQKMEEIFKLHDHFLSFWRDLIKNNEFERIFEKSEIMDQMRSASAIGGLGFISEEERAKVYKFLEMMPEKGMEFILGIEQS